MKQTLLALSLALAATSFGIANAGVLKVGASPVPHAEILEHVKPALEKEGVDLQIIEFNDYVQPQLAVAEGQLDANYSVHKPFLDAFIKDHGSDLISAAGIHIEPMGIYSHALKSLSDVKNGAKIALPNDPSNGGRSLLLLDKAGLIKLSDPTDASSTLLDITDNPKNLQFLELEAAQLPRVLEDVDLAVINTNYAIPAGLNPLKDALLIEDADSPYVNIIVATPKGAKNPDLKLLIDQLSAEDTTKFILEKYQGAVVPVANQNK